MEIINKELVTKSDNWGVLIALVLTVFLALYLFDLLTVYFLMRENGSSIKIKI